MEAVNEQGRLDDLEVRQTLLAQAVQEVAPILARINAELIRNGLLSQPDGLCNQDAIGTVARLATDAHFQAPPPRSQTALAEHGTALRQTSA